jgi:dTDP-glucose 4,6-dehydratase
MRKILVTGGAGFIGSNFVEKVFDRHPDDEIVVLDVFTYASNPENIPERIAKSKRFSLVRGNIRDPEVVNALVSKVDAVVHFAAESHVTRSIADDTVFFETDVMGTHTIANAVAKNRSRIEKFVHISTSEVYGTAESAPMTEDHPLNPCTPYAAAKAGADRLVYAYRICHDIPLVLIRPFNNYGPKQHLEKVVPRFITQAICDEPLRVHGNGLMTRDWIYVEDTCDAVLSALNGGVVGDKRLCGQTINLGTGTDTSINDIAEAVVDFLGKPRHLIEHVEARPGQVDRHISSTTKSWELLGWKPKTTLFGGLPRTIRWYQENRAWWEKQRQASEVTVAHRKTGKLSAF